MEGEKMRPTLPEVYKIVSASAGAVTTNGGFTCDYVSLKNINMAWIVCHFDQAVGHATLIQPQRATAVLPSGAVSITENAEIWANEATGTSDLLVRQADATSFTVGALISTKLVIIRVDPAGFPVSGAFDVLGCTVSNSGAATNFASVVYWLEGRYQADQPPAAITD